VTRFIVPATTLTALLALVLTLAPSFAGAANAKPAAAPAAAEQPLLSQLSSFTTIQGATAALTKTAVKLSLLFVWIVVAVVVTLFAGREVRYSSVEVRASALYCFALGLVAFTSFVITAIVFSYLVPYFVGVPLLAALGVFAILTKVFGMISVFHAAGAIVAGSRTRSQLEQRRWFRGDLAMVIVGLVVLGAIRLIPVVGTIIWSLASVFGIGTALATRFGRRDPAFLAWRPAEA
jgi:beta-lactamase regulating signal transducer with metallopeptidase domain